MTQRLVIYVTLFGDSTAAEWYAVSDTDSNGSDLWSDGLSPVSKLPSDVAQSLSQWLKEQTAAPSSSQSHSPT